MTETLENAMGELDQPALGARRLWIGLLASTWLGLLTASGCSRGEAGTKAVAPEPPPISVRLTEVKELTVPRIVTLSGTLVGGQEAQVAAGAAGKVVATFVERGSYVKKGAVLARLDARALSAQAAQAAADVEAMKAQAAQAKLDCERTERLLEKGAITKADYERAHTQCATTRWSVSAAEARKTLTAEALRDTEIRAPFSGMVVERAVTAGEYVRPDSRVATLVAVDTLRVEITVPEADLPLVKPGLQVSFRVASGDPSRVYAGTLRYVGPAVRRQSRDGVVEAIFKNEANELRPGMFVTARLPLGQQKLPAVPAKAIRDDGTLRHVYVVVGDRLEDRLVQTGDVAPGGGAGGSQGAGAQPSGSPAGEVPIISGVKPGERVVAELTADVRDGARVK